MAQPARPSATKWPNPCAAFRPPPLPARRPDATATAPPPSPSPARPKDAPCPATSGDRGHSGQCKRTPDNVMHRPSGGKYSKPDARVKLIPAEDIITYARHNKSFGKPVGSADLHKRRRSVTPPPSSRRVSLARSTTPQKTSSLSAKRHETAGNSQTVSLKKPSPFCKAVQGGTVPPVVLPKESEMNPISPSSVHVIPAHSSKVNLATKAKPSSRICSTSNQQTNLEASISCNMSSGAATVLPTKLYKKPDQSKSKTQAPHVETSNDFQAVPSTKIHTRNEIQTNQEASISRNMSSGVQAILDKELYKKPYLPESKTPGPCVDLSNDLDAKSHIMNERQTKQEASISCNMPSGAPAVLPTKVHKKPDQSKSTIQSPHVEQSHIRNARQINQEASTSCNMSVGAQAILHTELYKKPYQPESTTQGPCVELSNNLDIASTKRHMKNERQTNQEASTSCHMPSGAPLILHTEPRKNDACWKGKFEVTGELTHTSDEIEARFPGEIFIKVYEASKQMPEVLKLEALPLSHLLPKKFKMEPPDAQDIGLYFICSHQRPNRKFDHLLEKISSHIGLRTDIGTTELLIFSSKLLTQDDQTKDGRFYFCGVFRKHPRKKSGIKLDLTGEEGTNGINKCMSVLKTPDAKASSNAAPAVSFFTGSCSPVSAGTPCKAATRAPASGDLILDSPPGDVPPPGFTSVPTGETACSRLVLDSPGDVPPGFTPAHRGLHSNGVSTLLSEKKSTIKFALGVTRPVQTDDIPPGFSKPIGRVIGKEIKHDKVDEEVDDGSEERPFPKIKRLSDILGFSSRNNASTSSSEVCISAAAVQRASRFQETGPSEIEKHGWKRGQPEPSEPSAAEATKRLKVNGRIALNRCMDRRALNSNQAQGNGGKS